MCNLVFCTCMSRFTCIVSSLVFVKIWMQWGIALSSAFYRIYVVFSFNFCQISKKAYRYLPGKKMNQNFLQICTSTLNVFHNYSFMKFCLVVSEELCWQIKQDWQIGQKHFTLLVAWGIIINRLTGIDSHLNIQDYNRSYRKAHITSPTPALRIYFSKQWQTAL